MGTEEGQDKKKQQPHVVENEDALFFSTNLKNKFTRKTKDGTTIVFYDFPKEGKEEYRGEGQTFDLKPANNVLIKNFIEATEEVEGIADIKFFNINNLSEQDKGYLYDKKIRIPNKADIKVYSSDYMTADGFATAQNIKQAMPRDYEEHFTKKDDGIYIISSNYIDGNNDEGLEYLMRHELGHILGLKHPFVTVRHNDNILSNAMDNVSKTLMSYNTYDKNLNNIIEDYTKTTYQELDIKALIKLYGKSKNPTPDLEQKLQAEEAAQDNAACLRIEEKAKKDEFSREFNDFHNALDNKLKQLISDGVFDKNNLGALSQEANKLRDNIFTPENLKLAEAVPDFGIIRLTDYLSNNLTEDIIRIDDIKEYSEVKGFEAEISDDTFHATKIYEYDLFTLKNKNENTPQK